MKKSLIFLSFNLFVFLLVFFSCKMNKLFVQTTGVTITSDSLVVNIGSIDTIKALVLPVNATDTSLRWQSSDSTIVSVRSNGIIKAMSPGNALVKASTVDGKYSASCKVIVHIPATGIAISKSAVTIGIGSNYTLTDSVIPSNATNNSVIWGSADVNIATVSSNGVISGKSVGTDTIFVKTSDGKFKANCLVSIVNTTVTIPQPNLSIGIGNKDTLQALVSPLNICDNSVSWESSNSSIATVSENGILTGISDGIDTISAVAKQGNAKAWYIINVNSLYNGLMAYYKFNGNVLDESQYKNNGSYHGRSEYTSDRNNEANNAIDLNGTTDYVEVPNSASLNPSNQLTISVWLNISSYPNTYTSFIDKGGPTLDGFTNREYFGYFNDQGNIFLESSGDNQPHNYVGTALPGLNQWFLYTVEVDRINHKMQIYINGELKNEVADSYSSFTINNYPLEIGKWNETNFEYAPYFEGKMDDLMIFNRVLSQAEITSIYHSNGK